jgi:xanthine/uracil permease
MGDLVKVVGVLVASSLFLLGLATLIQLIEQLIREPGTSETRH